jgi:hypothetical protein
METFEEKMKGFCDKQNELSNEMHKALVELVNANGGEIDTSNEDGTKDTSYAFVFNEFAESYSDFKVDKVRTTSGCLEIHLPDYYSEDENDLWFNVMGGICLFNATLYSLCECLHEYVNS